MNIQAARKGGEPTAKLGLTTLTKPEGTDLKDMLQTVVSDTSLTSVCCVSSAYETETAIARATHAI